ncbi:acetyltransferase [Mycobacterium sp. 852014-52144_SCH5372336]|uniref:acetyltransferase n=1 Tax=Mycobacterium sp. 852014-52144_SCH5372336 TaxID=1834115 RepID=UPI0007FF814C|nr:acetyltransferase [Mycobacterium sp. 852014-52144_SCH5372336]OBB71198.1 acetyltransferase [Mycobacterium sp. 852014-52144_SCH5372336]
MSARITPLRLEAFEQLPKHARRCVYWEVDPSTLGRDATGAAVPGVDDHLSDPEFEKEAWLSMVMLEWGSCGQVAVQCAEGETDDGPVPLRGDEACLGYAFYAPPGAVPRAHRFPTAPVSADAVLLTSLGIESGEDSEGLSRALISAVVGDLVRRGARALEAFAHTTEVRELAEPGAVTPALRPVVEVLGDCSVEQCVLDADLLLDAGFVVVAQHRYFPRLRLELEQGLGWKADVEAALERLFEFAQIRQPVGAGASSVSLTAIGGQDGLTRPACSTESSWASSSANVKVPVGRSFLPSR